MILLGLSSCNAVDDNISISGNIQDNITTHVSLDKSCSNLENTENIKSDNNIKTSISNKKNVIKKEENIDNTVYVDANHGDDNNSGDELNPFQTLNKAINSSRNNSIINMKNGEYKLNQTILINKNLIINGENNTSTIINCNKNIGFNLTDTKTMFNNIKIINSRNNMQNMVNGGAVILNSNANITLNNTIFTENSGNIGSVIFATGKDTNIIVENSVFNNNRATRKSAVLYLDGNHCLVNIINSTFNNNQVNLDSSYSNEGQAGVIYVESNNNITLINSTFRNNKAVSGGCIYTSNDGSMKIINSNFINNTAKSGGVIFTNNTYLNLENSTFKSNKAENGGVLFMCNSSQLNVNNSVFDENTASNKGGAIYVIGNVRENTNLDNTNFTNNKAVEDGGAIYIKVEFVFMVEFRNLNFINNTLNSTYILNNKTCYSQGGALYSESIEMLNLINNNFINNKASDGGAICLKEGSTDITDNSVFLNNTATRNGGAISVEENSLYLSHVYFNNNTAYENGGAMIINQGNIRDSFTTFDNNYAKYGGAIYVTNRSIISMNSISFLNNTAVESGGALHITQTESSINWCVFNGNKAIIKSDNIYENNNINFTLNNTYFAQKDLQYKSNLFISVNEKESVVTINETTTPLKIKLTTNTNGIIRIIGNNYKIPITTTPRKLIIPFELTNDNWYTQTLPFPTHTGETLIYADNNLIANVTKYAVNLTVKTNTPHAFDDLIVNVDVKFGKIKLSTGSVNFKINGKTLKDNKENTIFLDVRNGKATLNYTLPTYMKPGKYNISCIYNDPTYNMSINTVDFNIEKAVQTPTTTKITSITQNISVNEKLEIKAEIKDANNKIVNTGHVTIKIDGITQKNPDQTNIEIPVENGTIKYTTKIGEEYKLGIHNITLTYQANKQYTESSTSAVFNLSKPTYPIINVNSYTAFTNALNSLKQQTLNPHSIATINFTRGNYNLTQTVSWQNATYKILRIYGNGNLVDANHKQFMKVAEGYTLELYNFKIRCAQSERGSVIYNNHGTINIYDSIFLNSTATKNGGVIYNDHGKVKILNSSFSNNVAENGAVIYNNNGFINETKSYFSFNTANRRGVNYNIGETIIIKSTYKNNNAKINGGVNFNDKNKITITNSSLLNNKATKYGGCNYNNVNAKLNITATQITNNTAENGGANANYGSLTIKSSNLNQNKATRGGCNYNYKDLEIIKSTFKNNQATTNAAVNYNDHGKININDSTLIKNTAKQDGGCNYNNNGNITINNTKNINNTAKRGEVNYNLKGTLTNTNTTTTPENNNTNYNEKGIIKNEQ